MSRAMSRSGRPPLAGGSAVAGGKNISLPSRRALSSRRAVDCAKLLANFAGNRAGHPASRAAAPGSGGGGRRVHHLEDESFGVKEQRDGSI
jgi:hypothetical protein